MPFGEKRGKCGTTAIMSNLVIYILKIPIYEYFVRQIQGWWDQISEKLKGKVNK